jgi:arylsulfatase A-like enzyme
MLRPLAILILLATVQTVMLAGERPNILLLLADDQRPDTIRALGNDRIETPNLDALVKRGLSFSRATCSYPICVVSRAEILSGMHGWQNGIDGLATGGFDKGVTFWADTLRQAGYETWYVGKWHTPSRPSHLGYTGVKALFSGGGDRFWRDRHQDWKGFPITGYRGWVFQSEDGRTLFPEQGVGLTGDISSKFADAAIQVVRRKSAKPWFLHVNFTAPHDPLIMPPGYDGKYRSANMRAPENFLPRHPFDHGNFDGRDEMLMSQPRTRDAVQDELRMYYSVIDDLDRQIGRILAALDESGQRAGTIIIFSSDHGLAMGSHGLRGKQNMYEHTIGVPLVMAGPGIRAGHSTAAQVYLRELYPTTCELAGVEVPAAVTGKSFAAVARGRHDEHHEAIFGYYQDSQRMIRTARWKLIHYPRANRWQLFDLQADPHELENLADDPKRQAVVAELRAKLQTWRSTMGDPAR